MKNKSKTVVIGLDGMTFDILLPLIDKGKLPALANLLQNSAYGTLESTVPAVSAPAWVSFATGKNPGKHGVFGWGVPDRYMFNPINANYISDKTLWDIFSDNNRKVIVINVPFTYPPGKVNGLMISGMLTPGTHVTFTYPEELYLKLRKQFGEYQIDLNKAHYENKPTEVFLSDLTRLTENRANASLYLMDEFDWDIFILVFSETDRLQHVLWEYIDTSVSPKDDNERRYRQMVVTYYQKLDKYIENIIEKSGKDTNVFIVSDHGFGPLRKIVQLNRWLIQEELLVPMVTKKSKLINQLVPKLGAIGLKRNKLLTIADMFGMKRHVASKTQTFRRLESSVNWQKTKAFLNAPYGMRINLKGREPNGIVESGREYETLREEIIQRLLNITDPDTGKPILDKVYKREEIYSGQYVELAADLILQFADDGYTTSLGFLSKNGVINSIFKSAGKWNTGQHRQQGIFIANGANIKKNVKIADARIIDVAPSILYLSGLSIPCDMDGKILYDIFDKNYVKSNHARYEGKGIRNKKDENYWLSEGDRDKVEERLKGLGYLG